MSRRGHQGSRHRLREVLRARNLKGKDNRPPPGRRVPSPGLLPRRSLQDLRLTPPMRQDGSRRSQRPLHPMGRSRPPRLGRRRPRRSPRLLQPHRRPRVHHDDVRCDRQVSRQTELSGRPVRDLHPRGGEGRRGRLPGRPHVFRHQLRQLKGLSSVHVQADHLPRLG